MIKINYDVILKIANDIVSNNRIAPIHKTWLITYKINKKELLKEKAKYVNNLDNCKFKIYDFIINKLNKEGKRK